MNIKGHGMGFFGGHHFDIDARKKFKEEWTKMSDSEKLDFMNKRMEACDHHENHFSVEAIDARCEAWMKISQEEKQAFIDEKKKAIESRMQAMYGCFGFGH